MGKHPLYIGIRGYAGSGKDTVTKMIRTILSRPWPDIEECKQYYKSIYTDPTISATYELESHMKTDNVFCIAFADQLKNICASLFGIPTSRFYMNKNTAWVCINKNFEYTEIEPAGNNVQIITANEYYDIYNSDLFLKESVSYYMSLRELLVYVGTYVLKYNVNPRTFVNVVNNIINDTIRNNKSISYVICTDVRFKHEFDFIRNHHGIVVNVIRDNVNQLENIAEHDLDFIDEEYDFTINNSGTYDDLFMNVWNMIHDNNIFQNITFDLCVNENINNYVRAYDNKLMLCNEYAIQNIQYENGDIFMLSLIGGPTIRVNHKLDCITNDDSEIMITYIDYNTLTNNYMLSYKSF